LDVCDETLNVNVNVFERVDKALAEALLIAIAAAAVGAGVEVGLEAASVGCAVVPQYYMLLLICGLVLFLKTY